MTHRGPLGRLATAAIALLLMAGCISDPVWEGAGYDSDGKTDDFGEPTTEGRSACTDSLQSPCLSEDPVLVEANLVEWTADLEAVGEGTAWERPFGLTECRWVHEVQGALLCGSYEMASMNRFLGRATMYIEGMIIGHRGEVVATDDPINDDAASSIAGHDLQSQDLVLFYNAVAEACEVDSRMCLTEHEQAMYDLLMGLARDYGAFVVVTFAIRSPMAPDEVVAHEILHAQYFLNSTYRGAVDGYWANLEEEERAPILEILGWSYDVEDDLLMRNEFQAYILMVGAEWSHLGRFVDTHRQPLFDTLVQAGTPPVQVQQAPSRW